LRADARFAQRSAAKLGIRMQVLAGFVKGAESRKNRDKQLINIVRVMPMCGF